MKIILEGKLIAISDFNITGKIEVDINYLYKVLKELGYEILSPNDSRNSRYGKNYVGIKIIKESVATITNQTLPRTG